MDSSFCAVCGVKVPVGGAAQHNAGAKHKANVLAAPSPPPSHSLPFRPGERECEFYNKTGSCKFGESCRFSHLPVAQATVRWRAAAPAGAAASPSRGSVAVYTPVASPPTPPLHPPPPPLPPPPPQTPLRSAVYASEGLTATYESVTGGGGGGVASSSSVTAEAAFVVGASSPASLAAFFAPRSGAFSSQPAEGCTLAEAGSAAETRFAESALLGQLEGGAEVSLNTHDPFCAVAVGVQGAGKSHSLAVLLEACLLPFPEGGVVRLTSPMATLVLHFDTKQAAICEATGLCAEAPDIARLLAARAGGAGGGAARAPRCLAAHSVVVLVSPTFYVQRKKFYAGASVVVRPLLLKWASLSADSIKKLMRVKDTDNQLYVASLLDLLRRYQRAGTVPVFSHFMAEVRAACNIKGQEAPLLQRLALLEAFVAEGPANVAIAADGRDVAAACAPGALVVVDLTDPLLSGEEAGSVFAVLVDAFRALPCSAGKVLALDEAHRYMADGGAASGGGLAAAVVDCARLMRHDGLRLLVSTQSPRSLPPELLELTSVALLHRFHSSDWFNALKARLPLRDTDRAAIQALPTGTALVFSPRHGLGATLASGGGGGGGEGSGGERGDSEMFRIAVRRRFTADLGASRRNAASGMNGTDR